jgi:hypothetical protein
VKLQCHTCKAVFDEDDAVVATEWEPTESPGFPNGSERTVLHCPECDSIEIDDYTGEGDD